MVPADVPYRPALPELGVTFAVPYDDKAARWRSIVDATAPINSYWAVESVPAIRTMRFATYGRGIWDYSPTGRPCCAPSAPARGADAER